MDTSIIVPVEGILAEWLERDGRGDLVDGKEVSVDLEEFNKLNAECHRVHREYDDKTCEAWAAFSIVTRKHISVTEQAEIGQAAGTGVQRVAMAIEQQSRDFRGLRGAFEAHSLAIDSVRLAIEEASSLEEADRLQSLEVLKAAVASGFTDTRAAVASAVTTMSTLHRDDQEKQRERDWWLWTWRIAVLLALIALCALRGHAAPEPSNMIPQDQVLAALRIRAPMIFPDIIQFNNGAGVVAASTANPFPVTCISGCGGGSGGTSSNFSSTFPSAGTAIGVKSGLNMVNLTADGSNNLNVNCAAGCAGGSTTPTDAFATPTTAGLSASFGLTYNGTTWDLMRSGDKNNVTAVTGIANVTPVGRYNATQPTLTDGRYDFFQLGQKGSLFVTPGAEGFAVTGSFFQTTQPVSVASAQVASGAFASGSIGSGAIASGAVASGAVASGAFASGSIASGACASGCIADGGLTALGLTTNAADAHTDGTSVTEISILKEISAKAQSPAALPANQSTNISQLNAHTTIECGVNGCLAVGGNIADGAALTSPTDPIVMAGKGSGDARVPVVCDNWAPFSLASTTALKIVTLASTKQVYICSINIVSAAANNVALIDGTKNTVDCDTATHGLAGGTTAATGWNFAANGGLTMGTGIGVITATTTASHDVCLLASGSGQVSGVISYTQF